MPLEPPANCDRHIGNSRQAGSARDFYVPIIVQKEAQALANLELKDEAVGWCGLRTRVVVAAIARGSPLFERIESGDVLLSVDNMPVTSAAEASRRIFEASSLRLESNRGNNSADGEAGWWRRCALASPGSPGVVGVLILLAIVAVTEGFALCASKEQERKAVAALLKANSLISKQRHKLAATELGLERAVAQAEQQRQNALKATQQAAYATALHRQRESHQQPPRAVASPPPPHPPPPPSPPPAISLADAAVVLRRALGVPIEGVASCAVVGSSGQLLYDTLGAAIDSHDLVLRFNGAHAGVASASVCTAPSSKSRG